VPSLRGNAVPAGSDSAPPVEPWTFEKEYKVRKPIYENACQDLTTILTRLIADLAKDELFRAQVYSPRIKDPVKVKEKAERQKIPLREAFDRLHDMVGTRIVCNNLEDVDKVIDAVAKHPRLKLIDVDPPEKISQGTDRGYRGRNMTVELVVYKRYEEVKVEAEIQVRTLLENAWGVLSHDDFYKPKGVGPPSWLDEQMKELSDRLYELDKQAQLIRGAVEKRYIDIKGSLGMTVASRIGNNNNAGAFSAISESLSDADPELKLAAIETFIETPALWKIGMQTLAASVPGMSEWLKTRLLDKLSRLDPEEISQFDPIVTTLAGG
jgi:putative GTP pyrophosphokinase